MDRLHTVAPGDSLWALSIKYYQNPTFWPAIFEYNNTKQAIKKTGTRILDPDLILIKQKLLIPDASSVRKIDRGKLDEIKRHICRNRAQHAQQGNEQGQQIHILRQCQSNDEQISKTPAKRIQPPAIIVDLGKFPVYTATLGDVSIIIRFSGQLFLQDIQPQSLELTASNFNNLGINAQYSAKTAAGELLSDTRFGFDAKTNTATFSNSLTYKSDLPNSPSVSLTVGTNAQGQLTWTGTVSQDLVKGKLTHHTFGGEKIRFEIEVTAGVGEKETELVPKSIPLTSPATDAVTTTVLNPVRPIPSNTTNDGIEGVYIVAPGGIALVTARAMLATSGAQIARYTASHWRQLSAAFWTFIGASSETAMAQPKRTDLFDDD